MYEPKKLASQLEYSGDLYLPEIDIELREYVDVYSESLESHQFHESLKELKASTVGESVLLTEEDNIDETQFEEKTPNNNSNRPEEKKSFIKKLFK